MLKFACKITGDDYRMLASDTPASRKKVETLATVLFLPVLMWIVNVALLMTGVLECSTLYTILGVVVTGTVIFLIERSIIMSNGNWRIVVFRVFLGFLVATLGSIAFDEVIFVKDINNQMSVIKERYIDDAVKTATTDLERELIANRVEVSSRHQSLDSARREYIREVDGSSGTRRYGAGPAAQKKNEIAGQKEKEYRESEVAGAKLAADLKRKTAVTAAKANTDFSDDALLLRIEALFTLVRNNSWMRFVYIVFTLTLFALEFIVVIVKLSLPKSNYERKLEMIEEIGSKRMDRVINSDPLHFDPVRHLAAGKSAGKSIRKHAGNSLFN